jgi:broad specificity phosphatase PhoE
MTKGCRRRILAVRHGESELNVLRCAHPSEDEQYHPRMHKVDCSVTALGKQQGKEAGVALAKKLTSVDLFLISPLRRALQMANYVLESFPLAPRVQILETLEAHPLCWRLNFPIWISRIWKIVGGMGARAPAKPWSG